MESLSFLVPMPSRQADQRAAYSSAPWGGAEVVWEASGVISSLPDP